MPKTGDGLWSLCHSYLVGQAGIGAMALCTFRNTRTTYYTQCMSVNRQSVVADTFNIAHVIPIDHIMCLKQEFCYGSFAIHTWLVRPA